MTIKTTIHQEAIFFDSFIKFSQIKHFVSTRLGGFSQTPYDSLNLGFKTEDQRENVLKNRQKLADLIRTELDNFCSANQVLISSLQTNHIAPPIEHYSLGHGRSKSPQIEDNLRRHGPFQ